MRSAHQRRQAIEWTVTVARPGYTSKARRDGRFSGIHRIRRLGLVDRRSRGRRQCRPRSGPVVHAERVPGEVREADQVPRQLGRFPCQLERSCGDFVGQLLLGRPCGQGCPIPAGQRLRTLPPGGVEPNDSSWESETTTSAVRYHLRRLSSSTDRAACSRGRVDLPYRLPPARPLRSIPRNDEPTRSNACGDSLDDPVDLLVANQSRDHKHDRLVLGICRAPCPGSDNQVIRPSLVAAVGD